MSTSESTPLPKNVKDIRGERFGRLVVIAFTGIHTFPSGYSSAKWSCQCDCGGTAEVLAPHLRNGHTQSCTCLQRENVTARNTTHGMAGTRIYGQWAKMIYRCTDPRCTHYQNYGGRGISVCQEWLVSFDAFYADMGDPPSQKYTLERIDNNGGYTPQNTRWATNKEQQRNKRDNHKITYKEETLTIAEWAERIHMNYHTLHTRLYRPGWTIERALETPVRQFVTKSSS